MQDLHPVLAMDLPYEVVTLSYYSGKWVAHSESTLYSEFGSGLYAPAMAVRKLSMTLMGWVPYWAIGAPVVSVSLRKHGGQHLSASGKTITDVLFGLAIILSGEWFDTNYPNLIECPNCLGFTCGREPDGWPCLKCGGSGYITKLCTTP
jgi:hypothetical protein